MKILFRFIRKALFIIVSLFKWKHIIPIFKTINENKILSGKVALITGGSGGIGIAIAKKFKESGATVIISGTNENKLELKAQEIGADSFIKINMNEPNTFDAKITEVVSMYGKIDIFVCSHGIHTKRNGLDLTNITKAEYDEIMAVNLEGTYFFCQAVANYMIKANVHGHLLLISSNRGIEPAWSPYSISKHAINGLTLGLAQKLIKHKIIVNAIAPGPTATTMQEECISGSIYTDQTPLERYTMPEEVAEYAALFVSNLGDSIVGDTLFMSGGRGLIDIR